MDIPTFTSTDQIEKFSKDHSDTHSSYIVNVHTLVRNYLETHPHPEYVETNGGDFDYGDYYEPDDVTLIVPIEQYFQLQAAALADLIATDNLVPLSIIDSDWNGCNFYALKPLTEAQLEQKRKAVERRLAKKLAAQRKRDQDEKELLAKLLAKHGTVAGVEIEL